MDYFWDVNHQVYYFCMGKNGRKSYNFDDPAEFGDDVTEGHMDDEQPIGAFDDIIEGDVVMQYAPHGDAHDNTFGARFGDTSSIMTML